jgi:hypothetical protein
MARYLIESPHTKEECLRALDELVDKKKGLVEEYEFGCMSGNHTGYLIVDASSESEVREKIPGFLMNKAKIVKLDKFTEDQVRDFHRKSA